MSTWARTRKNGGDDGGPSCACWAVTSVCVLAHALVVYLMETATKCVPRHDLQHPQLYLWTRQLKGFQGLGYTTKTVQAA